jgi:hypothetical protein
MARKNVTAQFLVADAYIRQGTYQNMCSHSIRGACAIVTSPSHLHLPPCERSSCCMARFRCHTPGCGRFVATGANHCARHQADTTPVATLREEIDALRYVLARLVREVNDLETLARHVPRVSSVSIQATRAQHQIGERGKGDIATILRPVLADLDENVTP